MSKPKDEKLEESKYLFAFFVTVWLTGLVTAYQTGDIIRLIKLILAPFFVLLLLTILAASLAAIVWGLTIVSLSYVGLI